MTIEHRISDLFVNATEVAKLCDRELSRRVVYLNRAAVSVNILSQTLGAMETLEREAAPNDLSEDWKSLRIRLRILKARFQAVIAGAVAPQQEAFYLFRSFSSFAKDGDFPIGQSSLSDRLSITQRGAGYVISRFLELGIVRKVAPAKINAWPACYRWLAKETDATKRACNRSGSATE